MPPLPAGPAGFAVLLAVIYAATVAAYFGLGLLLDRVNARNPGRRIQPGQAADPRRRAAEMRQSLVSILVTSLSLAAGLYAQAQGWTLFAPATLTWANAGAYFLLAMLLFDAWFYGAHRLLHTRALSRFHAFHHRSLAPSPWSNDAIGAVDTALCQGFYAVVPLLLPLPPEILVLLRAFDHVNGTLGHAGFEYFASRAARRPSPLLCTTFHDLHHSAFRWNYANFFSHLDRLFGTIHPDYDAAVARAEKSLPAVRLAGGSAP